MARDETIAAIRFGYGLGAPSEGSAGGLIDGLDGPDRMAAQYPVAGLSKVLSEMRSYRALDRAVKAGTDGAEAERRAGRDRLQALFTEGFGQAMARIADTPTPFRERLVWFWADHFTAVGRNLVHRGGAPTYVDEAIRPHVAGSFADMLKAVVTHPFMLIYLDQAASVGPASVVGRRRDRGLNENLAREVMELHTLGVDGGYTQDDVTELARLMTGLSMHPERGFIFRPQMAEPGNFRVMGRTYGGGDPTLAHVLAAMDDLARHPATAAHMARKLAVHFVADDPDPDLVSQIAVAWRESGGDLAHVYAALLDHPAAWAPLGGKARQPFDFVGATLRAVGARGRDISEMDPGSLRRFLARPMAGMGQPWMSARGPDGWPEAASRWITPQGLAVRITWARSVTDRLAERIGDPRAFLDRALADAASERLRWAVGAAETRAEGAALVLVSAEFNRR
ncbi:MAG: DUF1800 domain-containing protein [Pseudomonadota bacterium]